MGGVEQQFASEMDLGLYPQGVEVELVARHVGKLLAEKLLIPNSEELWIGGDGQLDPNYLVMMQKAVDYWTDRGDQVAVARFRSELEGAKNIVKLVLGQTRRGSAPPTIVSASDPGDFYVDKEGIRKSVTFVCMLVGEADDGWQYRMISIPSSHLGLTKHLEILDKVGQIELTADLLGTSLTNLDANTLIAFPVLLEEYVGAIDELAKALGYNDFEDIEQKAANQLALSKDKLAPERRGTMIERFTELICHYVNNGYSRNRLDALQNAMGDTFALEQGKVYLGLDREQILREIDKNLQVALLEKEPTKNNGLTIQEWEEVSRHHQWLIYQFQTNPLAREARASGCGGSGIGSISLFDRGGVDFGVMGYQFVGGNYLEQGNNSSFTDSTGKYKQYYDYRRGVCKHCGQEKPYVAHAKREGEPCGGWCSDCET